MFWGRGDPLFDQLYYEIYQIDYLKVIQPAQFMRLLEVLQSTEEKYIHHTSIHKKNTY